MVLRAALLILFFLLPAIGGAETGCRQCHPAHYAESGGCIACHRGDPRSSRQAIAHHDLIPGRFAYFALPASPLVEHGSQLLERAGCRRCHRSGGKGNTLAADLDRLLPSARPQEVLQSIQQPVLFMPDFAFPESAAVALVNALFAHSARAEKPAGEAPLVVHFEGGERRENPFNKHCGGCHRVLTPVFGGLGSGLIGPNLSGLTSEFYPAPFREGQPWTAEGLKKWLENPRKIRPGARMRPVPLPEPDRTDLLEILAPPAADL